MVQRQGQARGRGCLGHGAEELNGLWGGREERMTLSKEEVFPGVKSYSKD